MSGQRIVMANEDKPDSVSPGGQVVALGDGSRWCIIAGDEGASPLVSHLRQAMQMCHTDEASHRLLLFAGGSAYHRLEDYRADDLAEFGLRLGWLSPREKVVADAGYRCAIACHIPGRLSLDRQLMRATRLICLHAQANGGLLLHGALAERDGHGVILAGPWGVGKSTASGRLSPPWRSLCDDLTLVVRDGGGRYQAHSWPTWSRFASGGPGGSWQVSRAVPLAGVFFLQQAPVNHARTVRSEEAIGLCTETVKQAEWRLFARSRVRQTQRIERFNNICELVKYVPSFILQISPSGAFWEEIEKALGQGYGNNS
jgi:SynChlorMet cassette protein ScmC